MRPIEDRFCQLTPRLRMTSRDISAMRTRNVTWIGEVMLIWFSTVCVSPR